jgi:hypothetical protein
MTLRQLIDNGGTTEKIQELHLKILNDQLIFLDTFLDQRNPNQEDREFVENILFEIDLFRKNRASWRIDEFLYDMDRLTIRSLRYPSLKLKDLVLSYLVSSFIHLLGSRARAAISN